MTPVTYAVASATTSSFTILFHSACEFDNVCLILKISVQTCPIPGRCLGDVMEQESAILTNGMIQLFVVSITSTLSCSITGSMISWVFFGNALSTKLCRFVVLYHQWIFDQWDYSQLSFLIGALQNYRHHPWLISPLMPYSAFIYTNIIKLNTNFTVVQRRIRSSVLWTTLSHLVGCF